MPLPVPVDGHIGSERVSFVPGKAGTRLPFTDAVCVVCGFPADHFLMTPVKTTTAAYMLAMAYCRDCSGPTGVDPLDNSRRRTDTPMFAWWFVACLVAVVIKSFPHWDRSWWWVLTPVVLAAGLWAWRGVRGTPTAARPAFEASLKL